MKKKIIFACILAFLCQNPVYSTAENISNNMVKNEVVDFEETTIGLIAPKTIDKSNLEVRITKLQQNDIVSEIYTGTLNDYTESLLNDVDFSETDAVIIFDWDSSDIICIKPIIESTSNSLSDNQMYNTSVLNTNENPMHVSQDLSIESRIKINGVNVGENGLRIIDNANLSCTFNISNEANTPKTFTSFLVTYNENGVMQNLRRIEVDIEAEDIESVHIIYQFDAENEYTGKLLMWDSLTGMVPLSATVNFTQTSGVNAYYYDMNNRLLQIDKINGQSIIYTYDNMGNQLTKRLRTDGTEND